jgi:predicted ABC-type ATPase
MTEEEIKLAEDAVAFVKNEKDKLIEKFANPSDCQPAESPISLFMAGSPGAGKTEVSKRLIARFTSQKPIRIDADEIREMLPGYNGTNSHIFQRACSKGVDKLYDYAIEHKINVIMDSTFSSRETLRAIERSIKHGRKIEIYYLYQDPKLAWKFTKARETKEGRRISKEVFAKAFVGARENVNTIKKQFGECQGR